MDDICGVVVDVDIVMGVPFDAMLFDFDCGSFLTFICDADVAFEELVGFVVVVVVVIAVADNIWFVGVAFITLLIPIVEDWRLLFMTADAVEAVFK